MDTEVSESLPVSIYALSDPRTGEVRYVGKTRDPQGRYQSHLRPSSLKDRTRKNGWIKGLLANGVTPMFDLIEVVHQDNADIAECYWIRQLKLFGCNLTNGTKGGDGGGLSPDVAKAMGLKRRGFRYSEETKARMRVSQQTRCSSPVGIQKRKETLLRTGNFPPVRRGEENAFARFTETEIIDIRTRVDQKESRKSIALEYRTSAAQISYIVTGRVWAHVGGPLQALKPKFKLTEENVREIREMLADGSRQVFIAKRFGIHQSVVSDIASGKRWKGKGVIK